MSEFSGKKIHMVGIKGVGMTALCELLLNLGARVSGSDVEEEFHTDRVLERLGVKPLNFSADNISSDLNLVIYSSAYNEEHPERKRAGELNLPQKSYAEALSDIFNQKKGIMVAGSHGKTTTTALLGQIMISGGLDPTIIVGGTAIAWDSNFRAGKSEWMLVEGDEYQNKFLNFKPSYLIITNIDYDHPDTFPDRKSYREAFEKLSARTAKKVFTLEAVKPLDSGTMKLFDSDYLIGEHNRRNASLVLALARELGIGDESVKKGVSEFKGVRRRAEIYYRNENLLIMDDYAHHPAEISATLKAVKDNWPDYKIAVIFQPHTFSRTRALLGEFGKSFSAADEVILLPTYSSAREQKEKGESADRLLFKAVAENNSNCKTGLANEKELLDRSEKTLIITMGAGDVWQIANRLKTIAESKPL